MLIADHHSIAAAERLCVFSFKVLCTNKISFIFFCSLFCFTVRVYYNYILWDLSVRRNNLRSDLPKNSFFIFNFADTQIHFTPIFIATAINAYCICKLRSLNSKMYLSTSCLHPNNLLYINGMCFIRISLQ